MVKADNSVRTWAEPAPNWHKVLRLWKELWFRYGRIFGVLYLFLALYAATVLWVSRRGLRKKKFRLSSLNIMLVIMGSTRSFALFMNPYSTVTRSSESLVIISTIMSGIGGACTTSAVSILLLIVLDSTKTTLGPSKLTRLPVFLGITAANVIYLLVADLTVWFEPGAKLLLLVCRVSFSIWGLLITLGYLAAGARIRRNLSASHYMSSYNDSFRAQSKGLRRLLRLLCACAFLGMMHFVLSIYSATSAEYGVQSESVYVKGEWNWLALQTTSRILELLLSILMLAITTYSMHSEGEDKPEQNTCDTSKMRALSLTTRTLNLSKEPSTTVDLVQRQHVLYV